MAALRVRTHGYSVAKQLVDAHETGEEGHDPSHVAVRMDFANNDIGLVVGINNSNKGKPELASLIYNLAKTHKLWQAENPFRVAGCFNLPW